MFRRTVATGLELRDFELEDAEAAYAAVERNRSYLREWLPWVDRTETAGDFREFIVAARKQVDEGRGPQVAIWKDGALIGSMGCHPIDWANRSTSIGYWLDSAQQGKGIITRCSMEMLEYLFRNLDLHRVEIRCGEGNKRSCAIPERLGFVREGMLRQAEWVSGRWVDLIVWSMLADDWALRGTR